MESSADYDLHFLYIGTLKDFKHNKRVGFELNISLPTLYFGLYQEIYILDNLRNEEKLNKLKVQIQ